MRRVCVVLILIFCTLKICGRDIEGYSERDDESSLIKDKRTKPNQKKNERLPFSADSFVGTNLFACEGSPKTCFSGVDVALITARSAFELLIPKKLPKTLLDDELVKTILKYFYVANQVIMRCATGNSRFQAQKAFYDTLGGYLNSYLIPVAKHSYYAGLISLKTTNHVYELYRQCTIFLNTNGNGWKPPSVDFSEFELGLEALHIFVKQDGEETSCIHLDLSDEKTGNEDDMIVSLPKLEPTENGLLSNIWLPFKRKRSFNLKSKFSAYILLKYFETVTRCYHSQGVCQDTFNRKLKEWLQENIEIHLVDNILYPGLGAVLRILETLRSNRRFIVETDVALVNKRSNNQDSNLISSSQILEIQEKANKFGNANPSGFSDKLTDRKADKLQSNHIDENNERRFAKKPDWNNTFTIQLIVLIVIIIIVLIFLCLKYRVKIKSGYINLRTCEKQTECDIDEHKNQGNDKCKSSSVRFSSKASVRRSRSLSKASEERPPSSLKSPEKHDRSSSKSPEKDYESSELTTSTSCDCASPRCFPKCAKKTSRKNKLNKKMPSTNRS